MSRKTNLIYPTIYRYLLACHEMRLSVKTVSWYEQKVEAFRWYLMEQWQIKNLTSITEKHVEAFLMVLDEVSPITIKVTQIVKTVKWRLLRCNLLSYLAK